MLGFKDPVACVCASVQNPRPQCALGFTEVTPDLLVQKHVMKLQTHYFLLIQLMYLYTVLFRFIRTFTNQYSVHSLVSFIGEGNRST